MTNEVEFFFFFNLFPLHLEVRKSREEQPHPSLSSIILTHVPRS